MIQYGTEHQKRSSHGIGASEIAAALGIHPWRSRFDLWSEKVGHTAPFAGNEATRWGQLVEPALLVAYTETTGAQIAVPPESLFAADLPWARATPDAIAIEPRQAGPLLLSGACPPRERWSHVVQAKTVGGHLASHWLGGPPGYVVIQVQWEMRVAGVARADVVVSVGGQWPEVYTVHRDEAVLEDLIAAGGRFWRLVEERTPPPADESDACRAYWTARSAQAVASEVLIPADADANVIAAIEIYREAWRVSRAAEKALRTAKNEIASLCAEADAAGIETPDGPIRWQARAGATRIAWQDVAGELGVKLHLSRGEFDAIAQRHTTMLPASRSVVAPRAWGKD